MRSKSLNGNNISCSGSIAKIFFSSGQNQHSFKDLINFTLNGVHLFTSGGLFLLNLIDRSSSVGVGGVTMSRKQLDFYRRGEMKLKKNHFFESGCMGANFYVKFLVILLSIVKNIKTFNIAIKIKNKEAHKMMDHKILISFIWNQIQLQSNFKANSLSPTDCCKIGSELF